MLKNRAIRIASMAIVEGVRSRMVVANLVL